MTLKRKTPLRPKKPMKRGKKPLFATIGKGGSTNMPDTEVDEESLTTSNQKLISFLKKNPAAKKSLRTKKPCVTVEQMMSSGLLARGSTFSSKPKRIKPRAAKKPGAKTQMEVFQQIWDERDHVSEVSGQWLGDEMQPIFMSHCLPKGAYRRYKFDPRNIVLLTAEEHTQWHDLGPDRLKELDEWKPICDLYFELREEANGL